jgi:hypothetical protein
VTNFKIVLKNLIYILINISKNRSLFIVFFSFGSSEWVLSLDRSNSANLRSELTIWELAVLEGKLAVLEGNLAILERNLAVLDGALLSTREGNNWLAYSGFSSNDLSLNGNVVNNFFNSINRDIFDSGFISGLRNIFSLVFNFIIISVGSLDRDIFNSSDSFIISVSSFIRNLFDVAFSFV